MNAASKIIACVDEGPIVVNGNTLISAEIPDPCDPNPCQNGGTCTPTSFTTYECDCGPAFEGQDCTDLTEFCVEATEPDSAVLNCTDPGGCINTIPFASYGTPITGLCNETWFDGACSYTNTTGVVETACLGNPTCSVPTGLSPDPCIGTVKTLAIKYTCGGPCP